MLLEAAIITFSISLCATSVGSSDTKKTKYMYDQTTWRDEVQNYSNTFNRSISVNSKENMNYNNVTQILTKESAGVENVTKIMLDKFNQTVELVNTDESDSTATGSLILSEVFDGYNHTGKLSNLSDKHWQSKNNSGQGTVHITSNNDNFTTEITTVYEKTVHTNENSVSEKELDQNIHNIPYHIHSAGDRVESLTLARKKILLQHHLQLVPMEDEPLDAMMLKNQRYMISVLIPIGVGMIGAVMIVCTVFTLKKVASIKRRVPSPIDDAEAERSITPGISSISTETTDKIFLLPGDNEI